MCTLEFRWHRKIIFRKESSDETDISAKEKTKNERTRLQKENGFQEWQKRSQEKKSQRQKEAHCLILRLDFELEFDKPKKTKKTNRLKNAKKECFEKKE